MTEYTNHRGCPAYLEAWTRYAWPVVAHHLGVEAASALSGRDAVDKALELLGMAGNLPRDACLPPGSLPIVGFRYGTGRAPDGADPRDG